MLLGHNWVTNGSYLYRQISYKSVVGGSDYTAQESARKGVFNDVEKKSVTLGYSSGETTQKTTQRVLHNIRVNNLHANCMQIARKNYNLHLIVGGYIETEPQINADERRFFLLNIQHLSEVYQGNGLIKSPQSTQRSQSFAIPATTYETAPPSRRGTRMKRIARIFTDPCVSASSVKSAFYRTIFLLTDDQ